MAGAAKDVRTDGGSGVRLARMDRFQVLRRIDRCYVIKKKKSIDENKSLLVCKQKITLIN